VLGFVLFVGVIDDFASARRHPSLIVALSETGPLIIPPESLAPDQLYGH
jgi:hypothetical protein